MEHPANADEAMNKVWVIFDLEEENSFDAEMEHIFK